jgi:hypothetical protein
LQKSPRRRDETASKRKTQKIFQGTRLLPRRSSTDVKMKIPSTADAQQRLSPVHVKEEQIIIRRLDKQQGSKDHVVVVSAHD